MKPIEGFRDVYAAHLRRRRYLGQLFGAVAESFGFEPLEVPVVERAEAYSEDVVGLSPWPEWNPKGVFELDIPGYRANYYDSPESTRAVLIPEGTLSVTRWLGDRLDAYEDPRVSPELPLKIYYEVACYRNELLDSLGPTKGRQFTQFGIEILGSSSVAADVEVLSVAAEALRVLGVPNAAIRIRISSNRLYSELAELSGLGHKESVQLKELLDTLGECKAGKRPERSPRALAEIRGLLAARGLSDDLQKVWSFIVDRAPSPISDADYQILGDRFKADVEYLDAVCSVFRDDTLSVDVDYCVVRSHEYYTGLTFEIDLLGSQGEQFVEVGGGGRYDKLLGNFVSTMPGVIIPSMGYAFGMERLVSALTSLGHLSDTGSFPYQHHLASAPPERLPFDPGSTNADTARLYIATVNQYRTARLQRPLSVALP